MMYARTAMILHARWRRCRGISSLCKYRNCNKNYRQYGGNGKLHVGQNLSVKHVLW